MHSLEHIIKQNNQAVAGHDPTRLADVWPEGEAISFSIGESKQPVSKGKRAFTTDAVLGMARHALGYNFKGLEQGLTNVLRAERGIPVGEPVPLDALTMFVFSLGASTELVDEWVEALSEAVAPYADHPEASFCIYDTDRGVVIKVEENTVVAVRPLLRKRQ